MSLSIKYSASAEKKLKAVLRQMMSETICIEPRDKEVQVHAKEKLANLVGEVVQIVGICADSQACGRPKRYDVHMYVSSKGVEWQYFQVDR